VVLNGSRRALAQAVAAYPDVIVLHITVPLPLLAQRLAARGRESLAEITDRLARADTALPQGLRSVELANDTSPEAGMARLSQALRG
jgi:ribose 1,5-bisphosphokinase